MKILIDDKRNVLPDGTEPDIIIRNYNSGLIFIVDWMFSTEFDTLYIDHDLGSKKTGYDLLTTLEYARHLDLESYPLPYDIICVSDNPPGRARIEQVIEKLYGD